MPKSVKADFRSGFKIISSYLTDYKKEITTLSILGILGAGLGAVVPYLGGRIIDSIIEGDIVEINRYVFDATLFFIVIFFAVRVFQEIFQWQLSLKGNSLETVVEAEYVAKNISKVLDLPLSFHKKHKIGQISSKINRGSNAIENILARIIVNLAPEFISIVFAAFLIFFVNKLLASVILFSVLIYIFLMIKTAPKMVPLQKKSHDLYSRTYGDAYDAVTNVNSVKQATAENYEKKKIKRNFIKSVDLWRSYDRIWQGLNFYQKVIIVLTQLMIFLISVHFIRIGQMTIGELVMFNGYAALFFGPFVRLGLNWQWLQNGVIDLIKAEELLKQPPEKYKPEKITKVENIKGDISFVNVSFSYPDKKKRLILDDVSFEVKAGEVIAFVGESGVGKTTLIDLISLYYRPTKGKVLVDGIDNRKMDLKFLRSKIAVVPQDITLFNDTVKNNIKYGFFEATDSEVEWAAKMAHADHFIKTFPKKYDQMVGERGIKLSTGQRQRIALARAFLRKPRILILDEPTSALDARSESYVQDALQKLMQGKTTFIIAHRLSTVRKADKIIILEKGRIAETGKHEELLQKEDGIYRKLYELQIGFFK